MFYFCAELWIYIEVSCCVGHYSHIEHSMEFRVGDHMQLVRCHLFMFMYSHMSHNDVSVNNTSHMPWWLHEMIMEPKHSYGLVTT